MRLRLPISLETPHLPGRVRDAIRRQQDSSEIVVGWIQLSIVVTFSILYALSPNPYTADTVFASEPWVLGVYLLFTLVRVVLAHRRALPNWLLYVSVIVDMLLLLALIWSIHIKYGQPASFYLKVPTLLYVFIFIALRALRFEARYVLLAGAVAAGGWLLMVLYAARIVPDNPMITRDYVQYMTSNSILLGAEFDKVISMLIVTGILAVAITRARNLLVRSVVESTAAAELSRFVPSEVAAQLKASETRIEAGAGDVRETTIFFNDLEGFTTLSEGMSPVELISTLNEYFSAVTEPIVRHGGVINQYQGDAILATFNLPKAHEDHAAGAVRAVRADRDPAHPRLPHLRGGSAARIEGRDQHRHRGRRSRRRAGPAGLHRTRRRRESRRPARGAEQGARNEDHRLRTHPRARGPRELRVRSAGNGDGARKEPAGHRLQNRRLNPRTLGKGDDADAAVRSGGRGHYLPFDSWPPDPRLPDSWPSRAASFSTVIR